MNFKLIKIFRKNSDAAKPRKNITDKFFTPPASDSLSARKQAEAQMRLGLKHPFRFL